MAIRIAERRDVEAMRQIYAPYITDTAYSYEYEVPSYEEFLHRFETITAHDPWLVWEEDGKVLGYVYGEPAYVRKAYGFLADLAIYLHPDAQGKGVGRKLYAVCEEILKRQGYCLVYGVVTSANPQSCQFHLALGYREAARFQKSGMKFNAWHDTIWYEKQLNPQPEGGLEQFPVSWKTLHLADLLPHTIEEEVDR